MVSPVKPPAEVVSAARWRYDGIGSCSREGPDVGWGLRIKKRLGF